MFTKTVTAVSALLIFGSASVAFASTDLRETQLDFDAPFVEMIAKPLPTANNWGVVQHDSGTVNPADY
jgi:hypothetical protein